MLFFNKLIDYTPIVNPIPNFNVFLYLMSIIKSQSYHLIPLLPRVNAFEFWRVLAVLIGLLFAVTFYFVLYRKFDIKKNFKILYIAGIILFFIVNIGRYVYWISVPQYTEITTSCELGKIIDSSDIVIGGQFLGLENKIHFTHHHEKSDIFLDRASYLFEMVYHPLEGLQLGEDKLLYKKFVKEFIVCKHKYHLYKLKE